MLPIIKALLDVKLVIGLNRLPYYNRQYAYDNPQSAEYCGRRRVVKIMSLTSGLSNFVAQYAFLLWFF